MSLLLFLALFSGAFVSDSNARLLNLGIQENRGFREIVQWRQPICIKAGEGVPPCGQSINGHRSHYEMMRAKSQATIEAEGEIKPTKSTLTSSELREKISLEDIEPSSIEEPSQELREKTPSLDESLSQGTIRERRDSSEPEGRVVHFPSDTNIVATRVIHSPVTATLMAENCLPDIALPACDESVDDRTKGQLLISAIYEKVQDIGQKIADTKAKLAANIEHKKQMLVQGMESMKNNIYDKTASIVHKVLETKQGLYNKTASFVRGIEDKRQQFVEKLSQKKAAIVEAIFNATGQKKEMIQGAIEKKQTVVKNLASSGKEVLQNIIDAGTKKELEIADRKQEFIDKVVDKKLSFIHNFTDKTTSFVKKLAEKKAGAIKYTADKAQELIGTVSVGKPLVIGQIQEALGLKPHKELDYGENEEELEQEASASANAEIGSDRDNENTNESSTSESEPISSDDDKPIEIISVPVTQSPNILHIDPRSNLEKNGKPIESKEKVKSVVSSNE